MGTLLGRTPLGDTRLRVTKPGYNPLDMGLARSLLHFDSTWGQTLMIHQQGSFYVASGLSEGGTRTDVVTWPDLGFIPVFLFVSAKGYFYIPDYYQFFRVKRTGLDFTAGDRMAPGDNRDFDCFYTVFASPEGGVLG
ncbi:hypothetical protein GA830_12225 [Mesorhizobium sp. NBSH29]|uniref:hypothetical protein n=1 Tax=Mesorhizobium sp. NBSH29 TaxID=2654249 RepID=UPI001896869D|nr:hypothetical protein [Mesorhizobium sp. NBSH29]QPC87424.1 hypothetical protein GA830_12225 [Mesorhizobium sp. NBSH29]